MKKTTGIALSIACEFCLAGCSNKTIYYNPNLGFDVSGMDYKSVEFNVYHSKTNDHTWELLKKFSCSPKEGYCADVRVDGETGRVVITSEDNHLVKTHVSESYYCDDLEVYELIVDGFNGQISTAKTRHLHMKAMNHDIHSLFCTLYLDISLFLANILLIV